MPQKTEAIPVNMKAGPFEEGILISRASVKVSHPFKEVERAHRDDYHVFILQEKGTTSIEIDFRKYKIKPSSLVFIHPSQVHRVLGFENAVFTSWAISNENLDPEYLKLLEEITPSKPLSLTKGLFSLFSEAVSLCIKISKQKKEKMHHSLLKDSCNTLVGLALSQYLAGSRSPEKISRYETITKIFKAALEQNFTTIKSPAAYARNMNISSPYLNECVKSTTGHSVSYHIQERTILEAKRLLYHSGKSVKEIAGDLGYDDYSYFIRLFSKLTGQTPMAFRNKNLE